MAEGWIPDPMADWFEAKGHPLKRCVCGSSEEERVPGSETDRRCSGCKILTATDRPIVVRQIVIKVCTSCCDWFKLESGPTACPKCGGPTSIEEMVPR